MLCECLCCYETLTFLPSHPPHLPPICFIPRSSLFSLPYTSRRQSSGCASDIAQLSTTKYRTCMATFRNLANLGHLSNSTLENYCNMDCSNYIWNLLTKLARDCDPSNTVSHMKYTHMSVSLISRVVHRFLLLASTEKWGGSGT